MSENNKKDQESLKENEIKVSENILHHRGIILVNEAQQLCGSVTCPCHAWSYDLNSQISKNPWIGGAGCA